MKIFCRGFLAIFLILLGLLLSAYTPDYNLNYRTFSVPFSEDINPPTEHYVTYGKISLPNGEIAKSGGIKLKVYIRYSIGMASEDLIIQEGSNSVEYKLEADAIGNFGLPCYVLEDNYGYVQQGGYKSIFGGCNLPFLPTEPAVSEYKDKHLIECNLMLVPSDCTIKGTIYLPDGRKADYGGEHITISASTGTDTKDKTIYSTDISIPEGKNSADYFICVQSGKEYSVSYKYNVLPRYSYETEGFYHNNLKNTFSSTPGAITGIILSIIETEDHRQIKKRSLKRKENWELSEKTSGGAISLNPSIADEKVKFTVSSEIIDKWEKWGQQTANTTSGDISSNIFKLEGYCLYTYEKSIKDSTLVSWNANGDFEIKPLTSGVHYYYCQALFDHGLRSSISNVVKITYQKDKSKILFGG
jgi:hypothetical protein